MRWDYQNTIEPSNSCPPPPLPAIKEKDIHTKRYVTEHNAKYNFFSFMVYSDTSNSMMCGISI